MIQCKISPLEIKVAIKVEWNITISKFKVPHSCTKLFGYHSCHKINHVNAIKMLKSLKSKSHNQFDQRKRNDT